MHGCLEDPVKCLETTGLPYNTGHGRGLKTPVTPPLQGPVILANDRRNSIKLVFRTGMFCCYLRTYILKREKQVFEKGLTGTKLALSHQ